MLKKILLGSVVSVALSSCSTGLKYGFVTGNNEVKTISAESVNALNTKVYFGHDSAKLTKASKVILTSNATWLKANSNVSVVLAGVSNNQGNANYNIALGTRRANAVKKFLVKNGIEASRVKVTSYGEDKTFQVAKSAASNRRVEFFIQVN